MRWSAAGDACTLDPAMHLRPPSIAHGITSFLWALFLGIFIWIGGTAVGIAEGISFIAGCVGGFLIFLFVRVYGEDEPRKQPQPRRPEGH